MTAPPSTVDALYAPRWAGGWTLTRLLFGLAIVVGELRGVAYVVDALAAPSLVLSSGPTRIADEVLLSPVAAWLTVAVAVGAGLGVLWGGRATKPALLVWLVAHWVLLAGLGLSVRVPERMTLWVVVALLLGPAHERGLVNRARGPVGRWVLLLVTMSLYASTGFMKLLEEPAWQSGDALAYDLVDRHHAGGVVAAWLSGQPWATRLLGWGTIAVETTFPFLVGFPATSPFILAAGVAMHGTIAALMEVGGLGNVTVATYPVLLVPEVGHRTWEWARARWPALAWFERQ